MCPLPCWVSPDLGRRVTTRSYNPEFRLGESAQALWIYRYDLLRGQVSAQLLHVVLVGIH